MGMHPYDNFGGVWDDSQSPTFASVNGGASPTLVAFPAGTNLRIFQHDSTDIVHFGIQFPHSAKTGVVRIRPHVHYSWVASPTAGQSLQFLCDYVYAAPTQKFQAAALTLTPPAYTTLGNEIRDHAIFELGSIDLDMKPSLWIQGRIYSGSIPASQNPVIGFCDFHFQKGPFGTQQEYQ
jgi:hypothetical protein